VSNAAFQDRFPDNFCFGCGADNPDGLQIKSFWEGDHAICRYRPLPHHAAGPRHVLNGGIIATIIDCHCVCTAIADAFRREGREIGSSPDIWYATGSLNVRYLRPTPLDGEVAIHAHVARTEDRKTWLECHLTAGGKVCAEADLIAVRVPEEWRHGLRSH